MTITKTYCDLCNQEIFPTDRSPFNLKLQGNQKTYEKEICHNCAKEMMTKLFKEENFDSVIYY